VGVKDIIRADGLPTQGGSAVPAEVLAGPQAPLVDRLRAAGALVAGKTVTAEFAASAPGPTRNPHNPEHTPGGSSSGSAAAVAAGMVPLAIGTQTIGSVVRPAAFCGVVGFKPSYGRVPVDGVIANAPSFDTVGFFAVDVAGVAAAASVLCDKWASVGSAGRHPVLGIPSGPYLSQASEAALGAFATQVSLLRAAGFTVRDIPALADFDSLSQRSWVINRYEVAQTHSAWFAEYGSLYRPETVAAIREGQGIDRASYEKALRAKDAFRDRMAGEMPVDLWIAPSAPGPAPRGLSTTGNPIMCMPWSHVGFPALNLPAGRVSGLPVGLQCVARPGADEQLLAWAVELAAVFPPL
jgi:Asp-tRNA(Asn)/Glu-tRNA(Gln) amidotransferase A subunit family amidase